MTLRQVVARQARKLERQNRPVGDRLRLGVDQEVTLGHILRRDPSRLGATQLGAVDFSLPPIAFLPHNTHLVAGNSEKGVLGGDRECVGRRHRCEGEQLAIEVTHLYSGDAVWPPVVAGDEVTDANRLDGPQIAVGGRDELAGGQAALYVVHVRALIGDDQRPLELAHVLGVDSEVGLQRNVDVNTGRDVNKGPTTPNCSIQCRKLIIAGRDYCTEMFLEDLGVFSQTSISV